MEAKVTQTTCIQCNEPITFDFYVDNYSTEIQIMNGKKEEARTFLKECSNCHEFNSLRSTNREEWGNRSSKGGQKILAFSLFSCLAMVVLFAVIAYFAGKGLVTVWNWIF